MLACRFRRKTIYIKKPPCLNQRDFFLAPGSLARRRLARVINYHLKSKRRSYVRGFVQLQTHRTQAGQKNDDRGFLPAIPSSANRRALRPPQWRNLRLSRVRHCQWSMGPGKLHVTSNRRKYLARYRRTTVRKVRLQLGGTMFLAGPFVFADPILVPGAFIQQHTANIKRTS